MFYPEPRKLILQGLRLPATAFYCPEVVSPFYAPSEGDLDLVLCPPLSPHEALALECKRVKVVSVNADQDKITKLQGIGGGVCQANRLYNGRHAFFQTYLVIITEVEASGQDERNIPSRGLRSHTTPQRGGDTMTTTFKQIVEFPGRAELLDDIGIVHIEVVQPSRLSVYTQASVAVCVFRHAKPRDQRNDVTKRIREIMQSDAQWLAPARNPIVSH
jgi:hypothetical protein